MVAHRPSPGGLRPIVSGTNDVVQHIAKEVWAQIVGRDNRREDHAWADVILLIDPACWHSLAAHRAVLIGSVEGTGFVTLRIVSQGKGCVSDDFRLLRAGITNG